MVLYEYFHKMDIENWINTLYRSVDETMIENFPFPTFPEETIQIGMVGNSGKHTLQEMALFYRELHAAASCAEFIFTPNTRIMDFGCGFGRLTRFFLKDTTSHNIFGADCTQEFIDICKNIFPPTTIPPQNFLLNTPLPPSNFPSQSLDLVTAYSVFTHLSKDAASAWLTEIRRILKPGGLFVFTLRQKNFLEQCARLGTHTKRSQYENMLYEGFGNFSSCIQKYVSGEYIYVPNGGGHLLSSDFYGDTVVPPAYVRKNWCQYFNLIKMFDDVSRVSQAFIVLQAK